MFNLTSVSELTSEVKLLRAELAKLNAFFEDFGGFLKGFAKRVKEEGQKEDNK